MVCLLRLVAIICLFRLAAGLKCGSYLVRALFRSSSPGRPPSRIYAVECVCPDATYPYQQSLSPVRADLPPLIMHLTADKGYADVAAFLVGESRLPRAFMAELIEFGAVYVKLAGARTKQPERLAPAMRLGLGPIDAGSYARVHVNPRRYPHFYDISASGWRARVIGGHESLLKGIVVVDKPPGVIPTVPTVDNAVENVVAAVSKSVLGAAATHIHTHTPSLYATGRLDACTSGVVCFAKDAATAKLVNDQFKSHNVKKIYRALCLQDLEDPEGSRTQPGTVKHLFRRKVLKALL